MKSLEIFYSIKDAEHYIKTFLSYGGAEPEIIQTEEWNDNLCINEPCYAVYYNPPKM